MKERKKQRKNRKMKNKEEKLEKRTVYGYKNLTPYNAVLKMIDKKATTVLQ